MPRIPPLAFATVLLGGMLFAVDGSEEQEFPVGSCRNPGLVFGDDSVLPVIGGESCHKLCEHWNLTETPGTLPNGTINCNDDSNRPNITITCEDAKYEVFAECQQKFPSNGPYRRVQCVCGNEEIVACDSDFYLEKDFGRPPVDCASINVTSLDSCIDVATNYGEDAYCNKSSTPCILKYQKIGETMMCTSKWREGNPEVICGDACAWSADLWSRGTQISGLGAIGLAMSIAVTFLVK